MKTIVLLACLALSACSIARQAALPDGSQGYVISRCKDLSYCYNRAAKLCGGKYDVLDRDSASEGAFAAGVGALETRYQITVKCRSTL